MRIGHGYDVHRLVPGRRLIIGGVDIPFEKGLLGHSDADVLVHALMDAMLGAAGLGDIGRYFSDSDDRFKGIDSLKLLENVREMLKGREYELINADMTIIAQRPKLTGYIDEMKKKIGSTLNVPKDCLNIKATTEEHLGFTGEGLGIAAHAVVIIDNAKWKN